MRLAIILILLFIYTCLNSVGVYMTYEYTPKIKIDCKLQEQQIQDVLLLARVIQGESAGEGFKGQKYVGSVVLNRVKKWNKTLKQIIYQKRQFSCIGSRLWNKKLDRSCILAAESLLECGSILSEKILYFANESIATDTGWIKSIQHRKKFKYKNHTFYR